jgi:hypothetical protein
LLFFRDSYNATDKILEEPPNSAKRVGLARRAGGKGKGKATAKQEDPDQPALFPTFPPVSRYSRNNIPLDLSHLSSIALINELQGDKFYIPYLPPPPSLTLKEGSQKKMKH